MKRLLLLALTLTACGHESSPQVPWPETKTADVVVSTTSMETATKEPAPAPTEAEPEAPTEPEVQRFTPRDPDALVGFEDILADNPPPLPDRGADEVDSTPPERVGNDEHTAAMAAYYKSIEGFGEAPTEPHYSPESYPSEPRPAVDFFKPDGVVALDNCEEGRYGTYYYPIYDTYMTCSLELGWTKWASSEAPILYLPGTAPQ